MTQKIRVLLVDDHMIVRIGLKALINAEPDMEVIGEADNGAQALQREDRARIADMAIGDMALDRENVHGRMISTTTGQ